MDERSLYDLILQNMTEDGLPVEFSLPREDAANGLRFADGAIDGMIRYHLPRCGLDAEGTRLAAKALRAAAEGRYEETERLFAGLGKTYPAVSAVDGFQNYIIRNAKKLPGGPVYDAAVNMVLHAKDREAVKYGLEILELFSITAERTREVIRTAGLSDEFALFAVWAMKKWENGNEEILRLAEKLHGWGRIHAVDSLEPDTPEVREWLFFEGIRNDISPAYSALSVWEKSDAAERLRRGGLTEKEFGAMTELFAALLDEGPAPGISCVEDAGEQLLLYLEEAERHEAAESVCRVLLSIREAFPEEDAGELQEAVQRLMWSPEYEEITGRLLSETEEPEDPEEDENDG